MARGRIPSLDGLRALSIALVLIQHSVSSTGSEFERYTTNFGRLGVWIFFVISGFIITHLLLREAERGPISLRGFYLRRAFRLLPALFAFLLFLAVVQISGVNLGVAPIHFTSGALFLVPYVPWGAEHHPWSTGHLWSLAVEEHFYLLWPPLLTWLGVRRAKWWLIAYAVILPALRMLWYQWTLDPLAHSLIGIGDLMAYGALAAIWYHRRPEAMLRFVAKYRTLGRFLAIMALGVVLALRTSELWPIVTVPLGMSVVGSAVAYLLLSVCFEKHPSPPGPLAEAERGSLVFWILNLRGVAWVGTISYSLYLWQQPFLQKHSESAEWWQQFPVNLGHAIVAAVGSFYLVERPFLKLKRWASGPA